MTEDPGQSASRSGSTFNAESSQTFNHQARLPERLTEMDDEQFERHKEFMLQQQAQSAARIAQLEDLLVQLAQGTRDRFKVADRRADENDRRADETDRKIAALVDAQIRTEETVRQLGEDVRNLTAVVDRYFAGGHNGSAGAES